MKSSKGIRRRTRGIMRRPPRERGLSPITRALAKFAEGTKVRIIIDPSVHTGQPHSRFHGLTGTVVGRQGRAYMLDVRMGNKLKQVVISAAHLRTNE
ncbi:MAG: 50S ribosomal protein L21e [Euryarchaeota archaeon]|nr:50S ribosomal protein L21e [Euryarchaeota archaeon]